MRTGIAIITLAALSIGLAGAPASALGEQKTTPADNKKSSPSKKICRWLPVTGSNMNQKVCLTSEEWKKAEQLSW